MGEIWTVAQLPLEYGKKVIKGRREGGLLVREDDEDLGSWCIEKAALILNISSEVG